MIRAIALGVGIVVSAGRLTSPRAAPVFARGDTAALHKSLDAVSAAHRGVLGYSVWNLDTGERLSLRGDETFPTASLIKVPILVTLFDLADKKQLSLDEPHPRPHRDSTRVDEDGVARLAAHQGSLEDLSATHERGDGQLGQIRTGREHAE